MCQSKMIKKIKANVFLYDLLKGVKFLIIVVFSRRTTENTHNIKFKE